MHRLRVARALGDLPELTEALATGELFHSAIRELVRVATPRTEAAWRQAARGKNVRQIEKLVAGHLPGDLPDDPPDEQARLYRVVFEEVDAATFALVRQARQILDEEHGARMSDSQILAAMAAVIVDGTDVGSSQLVVGTAAGVPRIVDGTGAGVPRIEDGTVIGALPTVDGTVTGAASTVAGAVANVPRTEHSGRARHQILYTVCPSCDRATQEGAGVQVPIDAVTLARARCDAQHLGSTHVGTPERATQDIPPATVRFVWRRDNGVCQTPGCRSARNLEIHHVVARADGGTHHPSNLTLRCGACHHAHHAGMITIRGVAPDALETIRNVVVPAARVEGAKAPHVTVDPVAKAECENMPVASAECVGANVERSCATATRAERSNMHSAKPKRSDTPVAKAKRSDTPVASAGCAIATTAAVERSSAPAETDDRQNGPVALTAHSPKYEAAVKRTELITALTTSGWSASVARAAVDAACAHVGTTAPFESLLRESFRRCAKS